MARCGGRLAEIRTVADVAEAIGLGESTFRSLHRNTLRGSPGKHLRGLRLSTAEKLLSTIGESIAELSRLVGYRHPESFCTAFKAVHGQTPGEYRRWSHRFA